jgi:hypothetical protein
MKIHKGRICLMVISIAFLWLITGTAAAQYYIFSISFRENPFPHQGDVDYMDILYSMPDNENCTYWYYLNPGQPWLNVNGSTDPSWTPALDGFAEIPVCVSRNHGYARSSDLNIEYWQFDFETLYWSMVDDTVKLIDQERGSPMSLEVDPSEIVIHLPHDEVYVRFRGCRKIS